MKRKQCRRCLKKKPLSEFALRAGKPHSWCRECQRDVNRASYQRHKTARRVQQNDYYQKNREKILEKSQQRSRDPERKKERQQYHKQWREKNKERVQRQGRDYHLRTRYGITIEEFEQLLESQGGGCKVCGGTKRLSVDHDHESLEMRAILCHSCNVTIGYAEEDPSRLRRLADYLEGKLR